MTELVAPLVGLLGLGVGLLTMWWARRRQLATDAATGLRSRDRFDLDIEKDAGRGAQPTSIMMIAVGGREGAGPSRRGAPGDDVMRAAAGAVAQQIRRRDVAYRYGATSFSVRLPATDAASAMLVAERIRRAIEHGTDTELSVSVGVATGPAREIGSIVRRSGGALRAAAAGGRNRTCIA